MTPAQTKKYWREWSKVRKVLTELGDFSKADADEERHEIHRRALGQDKSSKALTNRDLDAIFDHFQSYLVLLQGPTTGPTRADTQPLKRILWAIDHLGLPTAYIESIARDQFGSGDWRALTLDQLTKLRFTLASRQASRRRKAAQAATSPT
jgi:hypothetical protein